MKKSSLKILVVIVFLSISVSIVFSMYSADVISEAKGEPIVRFFKPVDETPYLMKTYPDGSYCKEDFKIITVADPHFKGEQGCIGDAVSLKILENNIKTQNIYLIVICGDVAVGPYAEQAILKLGQLFERYNQYWGITLGNHDGEDEQGPSRETLVDIYSQFEHCVISSAQGISGEGNCIVNVKNSYGKVIQSLVFIDTGNRLDAEVCNEYGFEYKENGYDFIRYDQIDWYKSEMNKIAIKNGGMPNSIMFMHIPLKEYRIAYNQALDNAKVIFGSRREKECDSLYNTGMFDAILELGSTKAVVCGHDHINDYCVDYKGVKLMYSLSTSFNSYFLRKNPLYLLAYSYGEDVNFNDGNTLFSVHKNGKITISPQYNQDNPSVFEGLTEEERDALFLDQTLPKKS